LPEWEGFFQKNPYYKEIAKKAGYGKAEDMLDLLDDQLIKIGNTLTNKGGWKAWVKELVTGEIDPKTFDTIVMSLEKKYQLLQSRVQKEKILKQFQTTQVQSLKPSPNNPPPHSPPPQASAVSTTNSPQAQVYGKPVVGQVDMSAFPDTLLESWVKKKNSMPDEIFKFLDKNPYDIKTVAEMKIQVETLLKKKNLNLSITSPEIEELWKVARKYRKIPYHGLDSKVSKVSMNNFVSYGKTQAQIDSAGKKILKAMLEEPDYFLGLKLFGISPSDIDDYLAGKGISDSLKALGAQIPSQYSKKRLFDGYMSMSEIVSNSKDLAKVPTAKWKKELELGDLKPVALAGDGKYSTEAAQGALHFHPTTPEFQKAWSYDTNLGAKPIEVLSKKIEQERPDLDNSELRKLINGWTSGYKDSGPQERVYKAIADVMNGKNTEGARAVLKAVSNRAERWKTAMKLLGKTGVDVTHVRVTRGVSASFYRDSVIEAWEDDTVDFFDVKMYNAASASLDRDASFSGSAKLSAVVPIEQTLADQVTDDGSFVTGFAHEREVILLANKPNPDAGNAFCTFDKRLSEVHFEGRWWAFDEKDELIRRYRLINPL
jgi:hypothetical protein